MLSRHLALPSLFIMASTKSYTQSAYSVMLLQKLLSLRDGVSPLTLVLDSLQEPGTIVLEEFMLRAKVSEIGIPHGDVIFTLLNPCRLLAPEYSMHPVSLLARKGLPMSTFGLSGEKSLCPPSVMRSSPSARRQRANHHRVRTRLPQERPLL